MSGYGKNNGRGGNAPRNIYHGHPNTSRHGGSFRGEDEPFEGNAPRTGGRRNVPPAVRVDGGYRGDKPYGEKREFDAPRGDRSYGKKPGFDAPRGDRPYGKKPGFDAPRGDRPYGKKPGFDAPRGDRPYGEKPRFDAPRGDRPYGKKPRFDAPRGDRPYGKKPGFDAPRGDRPYGEKPRFDAPRGDRPYGKKPGFDAPRGDRPYGKPDVAPRAPRPGMQFDRPLPPPEPVLPAFEEDLDVDSAANIVAGRNPIREALRAGEPVEKLLVARGGLSGAALEIVRMAREADVVVQEVDRIRLDAIYPANQGMVAYLSDVKFHEISEMLDLAKEKGEDPFLIVLDGITDPHNLGAIVRTAECAGCHGVILPKRRSAGLGPACAKAAAGALNHVMVARVTNLNAELDGLKKAGVWVVGTAMQGEPAFESDLKGPVALVIGSEGDGISRLTMEKCDRTVSLPMLGQIGSLNASVAAGIILYEIARQRGAK